MPAGRHTVMTDDILHLLEVSFKLGCTDREACQAANIAPSTLYKYQNEHPEYVGEKELLKEDSLWKARKAVVDSFVDNPKVALEYLRRKRKEEFSERIEHDVTMKHEDALDDLE